MSFMYEQSTLKPNQYSSNFYHIKQAAETETHPKKDLSPASPNSIKPILFQT